MSKRLFSKTNLYTIVCQTGNYPNISTLETVNIPARSEAKAIEYFYRDHYWLDEKYDKIVSVTKQ